MATVEQVTAMSAPSVESIATAGTPSVESIIKMVDRLSVADRAILISSLSNLPYTTRDMESFVTDERFSKGRVCLHCGCTHVVRNGHRPDGVQRYLCKDCGESFVATSNTIVEGTYAMTSQPRGADTLLVTGSCVHFSSALGGCREAVVVMRIIAEGMAFAIEHGERF